MFLRAWDFLGFFYGNILWKLSKVASLQVDVRFDSRQGIVISYNFIVLVLSVISGVKTSVELWRSACTSCSIVTSWSTLVPSPLATPLAVFYMSWPSFMVHLTLNFLQIYTPAVLTTERKAVRSFARLAELTIWRLEVNVNYIYIDIWYDVYLTAIGLTPGGSSTIHIYTQTIHRTTHFTN